MPNRLKKKKILNNIKYKGNPNSIDISSIVHDSRKVKNNCLFVAISGQNEDGHDYILNAINNGATAVIANGRAPVTDLVPIIQVKNPRKTMSNIAPKSYKNPPE